MTVLSPLEIATGIVFGGEPRPVPNGTKTTPAEALEAAVRPAVRSGRCFVSFSGGRDSSAVLAAAAHVARREQAPLPVPITIRARGVPTSDETAWQDVVIRHLGLTDWIRVEIKDELDAIGPYARRALARHGLLWPFNAHFHAPMLEHAADGVLLTGIGGDELWSASFKHPIGRSRRVLQLAPSRVRRAVLARRVPIAYPWLRPRARRAAQAAAAGHMLSAPRTVRERMALTRGMRYTAVGASSLARLADDAGAAIAHPLLDPQLWAAVAAAAPRAGFQRHGDAVGVVAGHLLPAEVVARKTKASFDGLFFNDHARSFLARWAGDGVQTDLVDTEALGAHWNGPDPDSHSLTLLQSAWLASRDGREQPGGRLVERTPVARALEP